MLIDSHCHLDFPDFADELPDVIARAHAAGVERMITICTRVERFAQILSVSERFDRVWCSVGTHPHNADEEQHVTKERLIELAAHPKVVAIGEAGLDYHYNKSSHEGQQRSFRVHIAAARDTGLPLVIHARNADDDMITILRDEHEKGPFPAILHCFSSGAELARVGLELGFYVSFSGIVTFKNADELRDIARRVPLDRILVETDAPYLAPVPHRGRRNEPAFVADTVQSLADTLDVPVAQLIEQTGKNVQSIFSTLPKAS